MRRFLAISVALGASVFAADPTLVYVGTWPKTVAVIDEQNAAVIDRIQLNTDVARALLPTRDHKKLIAITLKDSGIETIDLATRKVVDSFTLGSATKRVRLNAAVLDPDGKYLYVVMNVANKLIDRFQIEKPQFAIVDLQAKKILKTVELPREVSPNQGPAGGRGGGQVRISPDGKYLWFFRDNIYIVDTTEFKIVETIQMAKPDFPDMESVSLSGSDDPNEEPGKMTAIFTTSDPVVHKRIFGIARLDLNTRKIDFTPIGPSVANSFGGVRLSPDHKFAYGVTVSGQHGDRLTEFFVIDMRTRKVIRRAEFPGRTRFNTDLTTDGKYLIVYGAGFTMELFDTSNLQYVKTIDINADMTSPLVALVPRPAAAPAP